MNGPHIPMLVNVTDVVFKMCHTQQQKTEPRHGPGRG